MLIAIDRRTNATALHRQVYRALRTGILEGRLSTGTRLPSSRVLANDLGVSRTTILTAYDQLKAEGHVAGRGGGGTRVLAVAHRSRSSTRRGNGAACVPASNPELSALGRKMIASYGDFAPRRHADRPIPFALGVPALDAYPAATWARLTARRWRSTPRLMLAPDDGPGYAPLREAIAEYVVAARALRCTSEQIVVTAGAQQGIDLLARLLLNPRDSVWVEEYGYRPLRAAFAGVGARPIEVPVDDEGLDVARGRQLSPAARLALVTPACEAPFGVTMSLQRRLALLDWAQQTRAWIIEDDYNGEFRYDGKPLGALQGLEHPGARRVIYLRTFSKTLFPALRLGYVVLPPELVEPFTRIRLVADRHSPTAEQAVLTDFIADGHFARHVRNMRELYAARQRAFLNLASSELGELLHVRPVPAGIRLVGCLQPGVCDQRVAAEAARREVIVEPLSLHRANPAHERGLVLGYVPFRAAEMQRGLSQLAAASTARAAAQGTSSPKNASHSSALRAWSASCNRGAISEAYCARLRTES